MSQNRFPWRFQVILFVLITLAIQFPAYSRADQFPVGSELPQFTLPAPDSAQTQQYLGLKSMAPFTISQVGSKLILVEFMSAVCPHCIANAPMVNKLYKVIQEDSDLAKDVKVIAIAVANDQKQVDAFKKSYNVPFPMFVDEGFAISGPLGGVDTPTMLLLSTKNNKVLAGHVGVLKDLDGFLKELRSIRKKQ